MSIRVVNKIPSPVRNPKSDVPFGNYREMIHKDISDAFTQKVKYFEITGYDIKPEYMAQLAREESDKVSEELVYKPARKYVRRVLRKEFDDDVIRIDYNYIRNSSQIFQIHGVTMEDGVKHVFCEIDYKFANRYKQTLVEPSRQRTMKCVEQM